ncbi:MAG: MOSC domain-containing protein [Alteromonadaceae bacterium]|nr:MOSC domain-containing protein [Alteromonadaceae bacterium]
MANLQISGLYQYPVKSLAGIAVDEIRLDDFGPAHDRRWMVVDKEGVFVTQRSEPRLALIRPNQTSAGLVSLQIPDTESVALTASGELQSVSVWGDRVTGLRAANGASDLLSRWLGREVYLVYMPESSVRPVDPDYVAGDRRVGFADGFPFLIVNEASLAQVNEWSGQAWEILRFRPGLVIRGAEPFAEDQWQWLRVGDAVLECVKPCSRCIVTTIDPATGEPHPEREPLRTLGRHRRTSSGVIFGQNAVHWRGARISVGEQVEILDGCPL